MFQLLFQNRISAFFGTDVMVFTLVLLAFLLAVDERLDSGRRWACVVGTLLVGVSQGLPLFFYFRTGESEQHLPVPG
jgi:hypothetical protein